jgi:hypothetical protein
MGESCAEMVKGQALARDPAAHYLRAMPLPRPASPRALVADVRDFWRNRPRHTWFAAALAVGTAAAIFFTFYLDYGTVEDRREQIMFIDSWPANRTDAEIIAKQQADKAERDAAIEERRRQLERIDQNLNRMGL